MYLAYTLSTATRTFMSIVSEGVASYSEEQNNAKESPGKMAVSPSMAFSGTHASFWDPGEVQTLLAVTVRPLLSST